MSTPIYQLCIYKNNGALWELFMSLPEEKRKDLIEKEEASRKALGVKIVVGCFSSWADEERPYWTVLRYPSLDTRIQHTRRLQEIGWLEKVDTFTLLGTSDNEPVKVTFPNRIYKLWIIKSSPAGEARMKSFSPEELAEIQLKHDAIMKEFGVVTMIACNSYWCNETYQNFGVDVYPNIEANMKMMQALEALGWKQTTKSFTLLGIPQQEME